MLIPWKHIQNMLTVDVTSFQFPCDGRLYFHYGLLNIPNECFRIDKESKKKRWYLQIIFKQRSLNKSSQWTFPCWKYVYEMARVSAEKMLKTSFFTDLLKPLMKFMDVITPGFCNTAFKGWIGGKTLCTLQRMKNVSYFKSCNRDTCQGSGISHNPSMYFYLTFISACVLKYSSAPLLLSNSDSQRE